VRVELLASDLEEGAALVVSPVEAFARGLAALGSRPTYAGEDWLFIVCTDHSTAGSRTG
jgi:hypothetical protein